MIPSEISCICLCHSNALPRSSSDLDHFMISSYQVDSIRPDKVMGFANCGASLDRHPGGRPFSLWRSWSFMIFWWSNRLRRWWTIKVWNSTEPIKKFLSVILLWSFQHASVTVQAGRRMQGGRCGQRKMQKGEASRLYLVDGRCK